MDWAELTPQELIRACAEGGDTAAWSEFIGRYDGVLRAAALGVVRRWGRGSQEERDDLIQEIYLKLCANDQVLASLREIREEAISGYLRVLATNTAHDYFRHKAAARRGGLVTDQISERHDGAAVAADNLETRLMLEQIDRIMQEQTQTQNGVRDRAVFRLYFRNGMTAKEIAGLPGIQLGVKGVEAVLHRLTNCIQKELTEAQGTPGNPRLNQAGGG